MKKCQFLSLLKTIFLFSLALFCTQGFSQDLNSFTPGKFKVKFVNSDAKVLNNFQKRPVQYSSLGNVVTGISSIDELNEQFQVKKIKRVFPYAGKFEAKHEKFGLNLWYEFEVSESKQNELQACIQSFKKDQNVQVCEPVYTKKLYDEGTSSVITNPVNDPRVGEQWHYHNTGQTGGTPGADISLFDAWQIESGSDDVIVAIIDGGIDYTHVDLAGAMWVNTAERDGTTGVDDDGNGYVDDVHGYGFGDDVGNYAITDHATHVGGTIGAVNNNGVGVAGIAGGNNTTPGVRLMSCAAFGYYNSGGFDQAFVYAADMGAVISQNSWGYTYAGDYEQSVLDAIDYFIANAGYDANGNPSGPMQGGLVVFAAGNDSSDGLYYPGYYEPVLSVSSTNHNDQKSWYSNYGSWVDIAAPGGETSVTSQGVLSSLPGNSYGFYQGTSMACPHVSGGAALIVSKYGGNGLTPDVVWNRLTQNVDDIDTQNPSYIGKLGSGRLNAYKALIENDSIPPSAITDFHVIDSAMNSVTLQWTATGFSADSGAASSYDIRYANFVINAGNFSSAHRVSNVTKPMVAGTTESFTVSGLTAESTYWFAIKASDYFGNTSIISNIVHSTTLEAPIITLNPAKIVHSMDSATEEVITAQILNAGSLDLDFSFPEFIQTTSTTINKSPAVQSEKLPAKGEIDTRVGSPVLSGSGNDSPDGFGYTWQDNKSGGGPAFNWIDISSYGNSLYLGDNNYSGVTLPFAFPFYGVDKNTVYISSNGFLTFNSYGAYESSNQPIPYSYRPNDLIAFLWTDLYPGNGGSVYYFGTSDKFIVQFSNVREYGSSDNFTVEVILYPDGDILMQYLLVNGTNVTNTIGIEDVNGTNGLQVAYNINYIQNNLALLFTTKPAFVTQVSPLSGTVTSGGSQDIELTLNSGILSPDNYFDSIAIESNDPLNSTIYLPVQLHVNGVPELSLNKDTLAFGEIFVNTTDSLAITLSNTGTDSLFITHAFMKDNLFEMNANDENFKLYKDESRTLQIYFNPVADSEYLDTLVIQNNTDHNEIKIPISGTGIYPPVFAYSPDSIGYVVHVGDSINTPLSIDNTDGQSGLTYNIQITQKQVTNNASHASIGFYADESRASKDYKPLPENTSEISQSKIGDILESYQNIPSSNIGVVIIGQYAYFPNYYNGTLEKYNLTTQTIENSFSIHSEPVSIAYDGTYLWIGTYYGNVYGYTLSGQSVGSFSCPVSDFNAIAFKDDHFIVCQMFTYYPTVYVLDYDNTVVQSYNSNLVDVHQIAAIPNSTDAYYVITGVDLVSKAKLENQTITISDSVFNLGLSTNAYSLFADNQNIWFSDWYGPLYKLEGAGGDWLSLNSYSGIVAAGETANLEVILNSKLLIAGFYDQVLDITTNDPSNSHAEIPVHLEVHGDPVIAVSQDSIIYDSTYVGLTYNLVITISNAGNDTLKITNIQATHNDFSVDTSECIILYNQSNQVTVLYHPSAPGTQIGKLQISSNDSTQLTYEIYLQGSAVNPPITTVSVDSVFAELYSGDTITHSFSLSNDGGSDLIYQINYEYLGVTDTSSTSKSSGYETNSVGDFHDLMPSYGSMACITVDPTTGLMYGQKAYSYEFYRYNPKTNYWDTLTNNSVYCYYGGGAAYLNGKIYVSSTYTSAIGVYDITSDTWTTLSSYVSATSNIASDGNYIYLWRSNYFYRYDPVSQTWTSLANSPYYSYGRGGLSYFDGNIYAQLGDGNYNFLKYNIETNQWTTLSSSPYYLESGCTIDAYDEKYYTCSDNRLVIYDIKTGLWTTDTLPNYISYAGMVYSAQIGYQGIYFTQGSYGSQFMRYETKPLMNWLTINHLADTLASSSFNQIDLHFDAAGLTKGTYSASLSITSNDPFEPSVVMPVDLKVTDAAHISFSKDSIFIEKAFASYSKTDSLTIYNKGTEDLVIDSMKVSNADIFSVSESTLTIEPGGERTIGVSVNSPDTGYVEAQLRIKSNAKPINDFEIKVSAHVFPAPQLSLINSELVSYIMPNKTLTKPFEILNTGGSPLSLSVSGGEVGSIDTTSTQYFTYNGQDTHHTFRNLKLTKDSVKLIITLNGYYNDPYYSNAQLEIEGIDHGIIDEGTVYNGVDFVRTYTFAKDTANKWLDDGILDIYIRNDDEVYYGYGESKNSVRLLMDGIEWFSLADQSTEVLPGDTLKLNALFNSQGLSVDDYTSSFTITSNDPANGTVEVPVTLKVRNQMAPIVLNPISDRMQYLTEKEITIDITNVFFDVNDDPLLYSVSSGNIEKVFASMVDNKTLKLKFLALGSSQITLSARDGNFDPVPTSFNILVLDNKAPEVLNPISDTIIYVSDTNLVYHLENAFTDADNDELTYSIENSDSSITEVLLNGNQMQVLPIQKGSSTISISAFDNKGAFVEYSFTVTVSDNHVPELLMAIPDMAVKLDSTAIQIKLNNYFYDADNDTLVYTIVSTDSAIAGWELSGGQLNIFPQAIGQTNFTIFASDVKSDGVEATFNLTVEDTVGVNFGKFDNQIHVYPNPFTRELTVTMNIEKSSKVMFAVYSIQGKLVQSIDYGIITESAMNKTLKLTDLQEGIYFLRVIIDGQLSTIQKVVKQ